MAKAKQRAKEERDKLQDLARAKGDALGAARKQIKTAARVALIAQVVIWLVAISMYSGLKTAIPFYVAAGLTVAMLIAALLIRRNLGKSEELGQMLSQSGDLSAEERADRVAKLEERVAKGEAAAIIAKAQLEMQDSPKDALATLEKVDLDKAQKMVAAQVRAMRSMIHLNLGEVSAARELAEQIDLQKAADLKMRANLAGVVAEAWARSGNPIEANQLLDKYDPNDKDFEEMKVQLLRARVFACVHQSDLKGMRRALKLLEEISPQLMAAFLGQKRIHPLLQQEAKKRLEKSGFMPKQKIVAQRR
jgi:hypothetical protein